jgi:hypothetical protein
VVTIDVDRERIAFNREARFARCVTSSDLAIQPHQMSDVCSIPGVTVGFRWRR